MSEKQGQVLRTVVVVLLLWSVWGVACGSDLETSPTSANYLPTDEDLNEELAGVGKLVAAQEWRKVIEICQKHIINPSQVVVEVRPGIYGSASALCEQKLRELPAPAKLLYRTLFDPEAERLWRRALERRDLRAARRLVSHFALTSHGADGMRLLGDLLFERGDVRAALTQWVRWMGAIGPDAEPEPSRRLMAAKIAVAAARVGDRGALGRAAALFGSRGSVVQIGSRKFARADQLKAFALTLRDPRPRQTVGPMPTLDLLCWRDRFQEKYRRRLSNYYSSERRMRFTCHGDVAGGILYVNAADGPSAFDVLTGRQLWHRGARNYDSDYGSLRSFAFFARVFPAHAEPDKEVVFISGGSRLAAHDAKTGRVLWEKTRASFARMQGAGRNNDLRIAFSSPVLCRGRNAYVLLETSRGEVHLLALDQGSGELRWKVAVGGSAVRSGYRLSFPSALRSVGSDLVFCNGHGIIGKCDAASGEIRWLIPYRRRSVFARENYYNFSTALLYSPIVAVGPIVVCMPSDSRQVIALRASDGTVQWKKGTVAVRQLLGAQQAGTERQFDRLFLAGKEIQCRRADTGAVMWTWPMPEDRALGLGRVTGSDVVVATDKGVYRVGVSTGELAAFFPLALSGAEPLNVIAGKDHAALVSDTLVCVVGAKKSTRTALAEAIRRTPKDPWLLAAKARLLRSEGRGRAALAELTRAVEFAKRARGGGRLVTALEREVVDLYHSLYEAAWKAGKRMEAFRQLQGALHSPAGAPYQCKLGYRQPSGSKTGEQHTIVLASGDHLSGDCVGLRNGVLTFRSRAAVWQIAAGGVRQVIIDSDLTAEQRKATEGPQVVLKNGDRISCQVKSLEAGKLRIEAPFGSFVLKLSDVALIAFGGDVQPPRGRVTYFRLRNGDELSGEITAFDGKSFTLDIPFCGKRQIPVGDVHTLSNRRRMPSSTTGGGKGPSAELEDDTLGDL